MSSAVMTGLGVLAAGLAFIQAGLPTETAVYIKLAIGAVTAMLSFYLGKTHTGTQ